jgi:hypothetical protein
MERKTKVIVLGDSFTFGQGCSDRNYYYDHKLKEFVGDVEPIMKCIPSNHCWPTLLQQEYPNLEVVNLAIPGNCNTAMFRNLIDFITNNAVNEDDIVLLNGTNPDRIEVAVPHQYMPVSWVIGWDHQLQKDSPRDYNLARKMYVKHLYSEHVGFNYSLLTLMGSYGYAMTHSLQFVWNFPLNTHVKWNPSFYPHNEGKNGDPFNERIPAALVPYRINHISEFDFSDSKDYDFNLSCRSIDYHVNDKGHSIYYEKQIKPLIEKFLNT